MALLKRKEEKTEAISVGVPGSAKAEFDELCQPAEAGLRSGGGMSEAVVRIIKQIGAELREPAGTATEPLRTVRPERRSDVSGAINGTASES